MYVCVRTTKKSKICVPESIVYVFCITFSYFCNFALLQLQPVKRINTRRGQSFSLQVQYTQRLMIHKLIFLVLVLSLLVLFSFSLQGKWVVNSWSKLGLLCLSPFKISRWSTLVGHTRNFTQRNKILKRNKLKFKDKT